MTPEELQKRLENIPIELERWTNEDAPRIAGKTAVDIFVRNFQKEGFVNNGLQPWPEVRRRETVTRNGKEVPRGKGAAGTRKILTGETANLGRSFDYVPGTGEVRIYNDAKSADGFHYADVHNKGVTDAGRNRNVVIPKRQIMGDSAELDRLIQREINRKLKSLQEE